MRIMRLLCVLSVMAQLLSGCTMLKAKDDIQKVEQVAVISGLVETAETGPVVVVLCEPNREGYRVDQLTLLHGRGDFFFDTREGSYVVLAFVDRNGNLAYDDGEPVGVHDDLMPIQTRIHLPAREADVQPLEGQPYPAGVPRSFADVTHVHRLDFREVAALSDPRFSSENGNMGMWEPFRYVHEVGFGLFWTEPRDPARIPVIFVHGAGGSPNDFWMLARSLDQSAFQPAFYYYPSGLRLMAPARMLASILHRLQQDGVEQMVVVAHSMGGLVSRGGILIALAANDAINIPLYITLSTPWGGHPAAKLGVDNSPVVLLNWHDMQPGSTFIQRIWERQLPASIDYRLLFSFRGDSSMVMGNNDGAVTIESQLDPRAQAEARRLYGHNAGHVEILFEGDTVRQVNQLLNGLVTARAN